MSERACAIAGCEESACHRCANCERDLCSEHGVFSSIADEHFCRPEVACPYSMEARDV